MLRIDEILGTEAATDIGCDKAHRLRLDAERPRREVAGRVDTLGRDVRGVEAGRSVKDVAESLGCSEQSLHNWVKQHQLDRRERDDGLTSAEREELRELRKRVKRVEQERDILKRAAVLFAAETETR